jgi:hypothetical protein
VSVKPPDGFLEAFEGSDLPTIPKEIQALRNEAELINVQGCPETGSDLPPNY